MRIVDVANLNIEQLSRLDLAINILREDTIESTDVMSI